MARRTKQGGVNLRRMYLDCRHGQLHVHTAFPSGGGFDERTALVCLHDAGATGGAYGALLAGLGADRSIYAPDAPGAGQSDPPAQAAGSADYASAVADLLDALRLREVDLLGSGEGAAVACALAEARPRQVRRLVIAAHAAPAVKPRQPLLELDADPAAAASPGPAALLERLREFLDRG